MSNNTIACLRYDVITIPHDARLAIMSTHDNNNNKPRSYYKNTDIITLGVDETRFSSKFNTPHFLEVSSLINMKLRELLNINVNTTTENFQIPGKKSFIDVAGCVPFSEDDRFNHITKLIMISMLS